MSQQLRVSEDEIIQLLRDKVYHLSEFSMDFKDDCALLPPTSSRLVISTDALIEDTHFRRAWMSPENLAYKSLAVNLSDLAAKAADPHGFLLSWALPPDIERTWLEDFADGLDECARYFGCPLLGGNTSASKHGIFTSISVFGEAPDGPLRLRSMAQAGDWICVTGHLGSAAAGLQLLEAGKYQGNEKLIKAQLRPKARVLEARWLARHTALHAMMDLSDGLRMDLPRMARASKLGFQVDVRQLPMSAGLIEHADVIGITPTVFALEGGEDYELLVTLKANEAPRILRQFASEFEVPLTRIGQVQASTEQQWLSDLSVSERQGFAGFQHFR